MTAAPRTIAFERADASHGETKFWNDPMNDNRDYHRLLAGSLIDDISEDEAWDMANEFGWDGVIAQLGHRTRCQITNDTTQH